MDYTFQQDTKSHMFVILEEGRQVDVCDLLTAEELALALTDTGNSVQWVYPEDIPIKRMSVLKLGQEV